MHNINLLFLLRIVIIIYIVLFFVRRCLYFVMFYFDEVESYSDALKTMEICKDISRSTSAIPSHLKDACYRADSVSRKGNHLFSAIRRTLDTVHSCLEQPCTDIVMTFITTPACIIALAILATLLSLNVWRNGWSFLRFSRRRPDASIDDVRNVFEVSELTDRNMRLLEYDDSIVGIRPENTVAVDLRRRR